MENPPQFTRLPESMELADIGPYFRGLREHYKLSEHDVSARLHIRVKYIQAIETSDVSQLPGKVYARGYIATYAEFLGIDPDQAVERLLGTETKTKVEEYFVPEPARLGAGAQQKIRLGIVAVIVLALLYAWIQSPSSDDAGDDTVMSVPESMMNSARSLVMPTDGSLRCVEGQTLSACLQGQRNAPDANPLNRPDVFTGDTPWKAGPPVKFEPKKAEEAPAAEEKKAAPEPEKKATEKPKKEADLPAPITEVHGAEPLPWLKKNQ